MSQRFKEFYYRHPRTYSWISIIAVFALATLAIFYSAQKKDDPWELYS